MHFLLVAYIWKVLLLIVGIALFSHNYSKTKTKFYVKTTMYGQEAGNVNGSKRGAWSFFELSYIEFSGEDS